QREARARAPVRRAGALARARRYAVDLMAQEGIRRGDGPHRGRDPRGRAGARPGGREGGRGGRRMVGAQVRETARGPISEAAPARSPGPPLRFTAPTCTAWWDSRPADFSRSTESGVSL